MAQGILRLDGEDTGAEGHGLALLPLWLVPCPGKGHATSAHLPPGNSSDLHQPSVTQEVLYFNLKANFLVKLPRQLQQRKTQERVLQSHRNILRKTQQNYVNIFKQQPPAFLVIVLPPTPRALSSEHGEEPEANYNQSTSALGPSRH